MGIDVDNFLNSLMKNSKPNFSRIIIAKDHRIILHLSIFSRFYLFCFFEYAIVVGYIFES